MRRSRTALGEASTRSPFVACPISAFHGPVAVSHRHRRHRPRSRVTAGIWLLEPPSVNHVSALSIRGVSRIQGGQARTRLRPAALYLDIQPLNLLIQGRQWNPQAVSRFRLAPIHLLERLDNGPALEIGDDLVK